MKYGIIGGGFGIYGYLPTVLSLANKVYINQKYKNLISQRSDVSQYLPKIIWLNNSQEIIQEVNMLIIAVPPLVQQQIVHKILSLKNKISHIILEKPIACTPVESTEIINKLLDSNINIRVGFLFVHLNWFYLLESHIKKYKNNNTNNLNIEITWEFLAHHFKYNTNSWKKHNSLGGGCLKFFAIHFIAVLSKLDFNNVLQSKLSYIEPDIPYKWHAKLKDNNNNIISIYINSNSDTKKIEIQSDSKANSFNITMANLFSIDNKYGDPRCKYLLEVIKSFSEDNRTYYNWYLDTNHIWSLIEDKSNESIDDNTNIKIIKNKDLICT